MTVDAEYMKQYGYFADDTYQADMMSECIGRAKRYLANADVAEPEEDDPEYNMAVAMLALHAYDHRGVITSGSAPQEIPFGVQSIIHQLADRSVSGT